MRIGILTPDSKKPNLAAMKISAWHKANGDEVFLNFPLKKPNFTYASILFSKTEDPHADMIGGPKYPHIKLDPEIDGMRPDYSLYPSMDYSLGYTYKACPRTCEFCVVPRQHNDEAHYSIWRFHEVRFKKISLLNNNTLAGLYWRETFHEIWEAGLTIVDQGGFDLRLVTEESAAYIAKTKFAGKIHGAWDLMEHEADVLKGIGYLLDAGISPHKLRIYTLTGFNTSEAEDMHRIRTLVGMKIMPFPMPYKSRNKKFERVCTMPAILRGLNLSGDTYESVCRQIKRGKAKAVMEGFI